MSRKKRFVEALTDKEQYTLEQGFKYGPAPDFRQRCQILLLSRKGYEVRQIINMLDVSPHTVYSTMKSWREEGIGGLVRKKGQGRKATLQADNARHVEVTHKAVEKHAQNSGLILEELYAELDIAPMSKRSLQRFLKKSDRRAEETSKVRKAAKISRNQGITYAGRKGLSRCIFYG